MSENFKIRMLQHPSLRIPARKSSACAGFSLTELAIVIGVMGIILAGVWIATSQAAESARRDQMGRQLNTVVTNIRSLYMGRPSIWGVYDIVTSNLVSQNAIPREYVRPAGNGCTNATTCVDGAWGMGAGAGLALTGGTFAVCAWDINAKACQAAPGQFFAVELRGLRTDSCINIVPKFSSSVGPNGLVDVVINGTSIVNSGTTNHRLPVDTNDATLLCPPANAANGATVDFVYRLWPSSS